MAPSGQLPIVIIACKVFQSLIHEHLPKDPSSDSGQDFASQIIFMDYGLHRVPSNLTWTVQEAIDSIEEPSLVVLGYGLCGNGLDGIKAGKHTLLVARADDCIAILLGSYDRYIQEFEATPGTYYLTKGWLESGSNPLQEYHEYVEKYGEESAAWIMDQQYQHYERLVFVAHSQEDLEKYRPQALEVARYCERWGMRYEEIQGSDGYVRRLLEVATDLGKASEDDFVIIPPGGEIRQSQFIR
ncbi:MAG TPA: DUF1638 domain-containing protein [Anaerolineales bacterium]|jgi:hypothetical protein|nr:DUF1638 domain-containing protein [Anaerolineales bacterium]